MNSVRLGTVALISVCIFTACAHEQKENAVDPTSALHSLSWPLPLAEEKKRSAEPADSKPAPPVPPPAVIVTPKQIKKETLIAKDMPRRVRGLNLKPEKIGIPKPKVLNARNESFEAPLVFDIPVAYNANVQHWIRYFQSTGRPWFTKWLERSSRYLPLIQKTLKRNGLPQDLAYMAMIESGFSAQASSTARAVGPWQFIRETGERYGLRVSWWLDERRDFQKSTEAASKYLRKMYSMFHNWYLVAAGYNTGENRIKRAIERHQTKNFWKIAQRDLEDETKDYVPKLMAALLISKAPEMYGFRGINYNEPFSFETFRVPGGTRLDDLADALGVTVKYMQDLNPELIRGYVPSYVTSHSIRIPKGSAQLTALHIKRNFVSER